MACGIGLQKLHVHNWGVVNSCVVYYQCSCTLSGFSGARGEGGNKCLSQSKDIWPFEWFVVCVDGCIDTRG